MLVGSSDLDCTNSVAVAALLHSDESGLSESAYYATFCTEIASCAVPIAGFPRQCFPPASQFFLVLAVYPTGGRPRSRVRQLFCCGFLATDTSISGWNFVVSACLSV